jgi:glycosyltransferase involved in cell wall biosynthesis
VAGSPAVSVVIPSRDKADRLRLTLACLAGQTAAAELEVVLVDDGSRDQTRQVAAQAAAVLPLTVVDGGGRGRAAARNLGAARSLGRYLVFLDDDILVGPHFVAAHLAAAGADRFVHGRLRELAAADRLLAELTGRPADKVRQRCWAVLAGTAGHRYRVFGNALERAVEAMAAGTLPDVAPWLGCVGANVGMARSDWQRCGGFDEAFGLTWGCEDLELGLRLYRSGLRRVLAADAAGIHLTHRRPDRWDQHDRNFVRFRELHPIASVAELGHLLGPGGHPGRYAQAVLAATGTDPGGAAPATGIGADSAAVGRS